MPPTKTSTCVDRVPTGGAVASEPLIGPRPVAHMISSWPGVAGLAFEFSGWLSWLTKFWITPGPLPVPPTETNAGGRAHDANRRAVAPGIVAKNLQRLDAERSAGRHDGVDLSAGYVNRNRIHACTTLAHDYRHARKRCLERI